MTAYVVILNGQIVQDKPCTTSLIAALRDNPRAIAEGDAAAPRINPVVLCVRDQRTSGTAASASVTGSQTRVFQTVATNRITGASLSSNQITLPAGTYKLTGFAMATGTGVNRITLYNVTDGAPGVIGGAVSAPIVSGTQHTNAAPISGRFTIAGIKVFELRHNCASGNTTLGVPVGDGSAEVYAELEFEKVA